MFPQQDCEFLQGRGLHYSQHRYTTPFFFILLNLTSSLHALQSTIQLVTTQSSLGRSQVLCAIFFFFFFSLPSSEHLAANTKRTLYNILPHGARKQFLPGPTRLRTLACTYTPMRMQIYIPRAPRGCRTAHLPLSLGTHTPLANAVCMPVPKLK